MEHMERYMMVEILRIREVLRITGLGRSSLYAKVARGDFPRPVKIGKRASGWLSSEVSDWLQSRIAESRKAAA